MTTVLAPAPSPTHLAPPSTILSPVMSSSPSSTTSSALRAAAAAAAANGVLYDSSADSDLVRTTSSLTESLDAAAAPLAPSPSRTPSPAAPLRKKYRPLAGSIAGPLKVKVQLQHDWGGGGGGGSVDGNGTYANMKENGVGGGEVMALRGDVGSSSSSHGDVNGMKTIPGLAGDAVAAVVVAPPLRPPPSQRSPMRRRVLSFDSSTLPRVAAPKPKLRRNPKPPGFQTTDKEEPTTLDLTAEEWEDIQEPEWGDGALDSSLVEGSGRSHGVMLGASPKPREDHGDKMVAEAIPPVLPARVGAPMGLDPPRRPVPPAVAAAAAAGPPPRRVIFGFAGATDDPQQQPVSRSTVSASVGNRHSSKDKEAADAAADAVDRKGDLFRHPRPRSDSIPSSRPILAAAAAAATPAASGGGAPSRRPPMPPTATSGAPPTGRRPSARSITGGRKTLGRNVSDKELLDALAPPPASLAVPRGDDGRTTADGAGGKMLRRNMSDKELLDALAPSQPSPPLAAGPRKDDGRMATDGGEKTALRRKRSDKELLDALAPSQPLRPPPAPRRDSRRVLQLRTRSDEELLDALVDTPAVGGHRKRPSFTTDELEALAASAVAFTKEPEGSVGGGNGVGGKGGSLAPLRATKSSTVGESGGGPASGGGRASSPPGQASSSSPSALAASRPGRPASALAIATAAATAPKIEQDASAATRRRSPIIPRTYYTPVNVPQYLDLDARRKEREREQKRADEKEKGKMKKKPLPSILRRSRSMPAHAQASEKTVALVVDVEPAPPLSRVSPSILGDRGQSSGVAEDVCRHDLFSPRVQPAAAAVISIADGVDDDGDASSIRKIHSETCLINRQEEEHHRSGGGGGGGGVGVGVGVGASVDRKDVALKKQQSVRGLEVQLPSKPHRRNLTRHSSIEDRRCNTIKFDPRIWVFEYEPHEEEGSNWFTVEELECFKIEAITRIQRSRSAQQQQQRAYSGVVLPSGTGRVVTAQPQQQPQQQQGPVRALFSDPALGIDGEEENEVVGGGQHGFRHRGASLPSHSPSSSPRSPPLGTAAILRLLQSEIRNILVIDPHEVFLKLFTKSIQAMMGRVIVTTARSAAEAQQRIEAARVVFPQKDGGATHGFDLIICEERLSVPQGRRGRSESMDQRGSNGASSGSKNSTFWWWVGGGGKKKKSRSMSMGQDPLPSTPADGTGEQQAAGDEQSQQRSPPATGSALLGLITSEQEEMERSWRSSVADAMDRGGGDRDPRPRPRFSILVGVSARLAEDREKLERSGADFVWGKPPPSMDAALREKLLRRTLEKRGKSFSAVVKVRG